MTTKLKKYANLIIAAILLSAMVFAGVAGAESSAVDSIESSLPQITALEITGIPLQITEGESPDLNLDVNANPPQSVTIQGISWTPSDITADETGRCTLSLRLAADDAVFSNQITVLINGKFIESIHFADGTILIQYIYQNADIVSKSESDDTSSPISAELADAEIMEVSSDEPVLSSESAETEMNADLNSTESQSPDTVSSIVVSGIPQTIVMGEEPALSISAVSPSADVRICSWTWTPSSLIPDEDGVCTLSVQLDSDLDFSSDLVVEANGRILQTITQEDGSILAIYTYDGEKIETNSVVENTDAESAEQVSLEPSSILIHPSDSSVIEDGYALLPLEETLNVVAEYIDESGNASLSKEIVWSVSDESVLALAVNDAYSATLYPISTGIATVTASLSDDDSVSESFEVSVYDPTELPLMASSGPLFASSAPLTASAPSSNTFIKVSFESVTLTTKQNSYYAYARFSDGTTTWTDGSFLWTIENTSVLLQNSYNSGQYVYLYPRSAGETDITVTSVLYPELSTTVHVTVEETEITAIDIYDTTISLGSTREYWSNPRDQFGNSIDSEGVLWQIVSGDALTLTSSSSSDNSRYVTINPIKAGTSVIRATSKSNSSAYDEATITIAEPSSYWINIWCYSSRCGSFSGDTLQLTTEATGKIGAELYDSYGYSENQITYTWNVTEGSDVISVTPETNYNYPGKYVTITPLKSGTAKVTVSSTVSGKEVSKKFTVTVTDTVLSSVILNGWNNERSLSDSGYGYTVYACDQYGNSIPDYIITIAVSGDSLQVSPTSVNSGNSISVTTKNTGTSTVTLKSGSIQKSYTTDVVNPEVRSIRIQNIPTGLTPAAGERYLYLDIRDQFGGYLSYGTIMKGLYDLSWSSSDSTVLQVTGSDTSAQIKAVGEGTATVTATMTNKSDSSVVIDSCNVVVEPTEISSVYMSSSTGISTLGKGSAYAYVRDQFGNDISNERIIWSVDKPEILTLSQTETGGGNGITLTPKNVGTATLRATAKSDTSKYWEQKITVEESVATSMSLSGSTELTTASTGNAYAYVRDQFGYQISSIPVTWSLDSGSDIVSYKVRSDNAHSVTITPLKAGSAILRATSGEITKTLSITVEEPVATSLSLSGSSQLTMARTGSARSYVYDQFGYQISSIPVTWSLDSGSDVVSYAVRSANAHYVDITPLKAGTAVLRATYGELTKTQTITVEETEITSIYLSTSTQLTTSSSGDAYAYVRDQFGASLSNEKIIWSVDNPDLLTVSQTETRSETWITLTPKGVGTVTLTATSKSNPTISSEQTIVVESPVATSMDMWGSSQLTTLRTGSASAYVCDQFGYQISSITVTWSLDSGSDVVSYMVSSNTHSVTITPLKAGTAVLRATSGEITSTLTITVEETEITSLYLSSSTQLTTSSSGNAWAYVRDQFGTSFSNEKIIWSVDNPDLLTVSQTETRSGYSVTLTPKGVGTVTLTATSKSNPTISSEQTIVIESPVATSLSLSGSSQVTTARTGSASAYVRDQFGYQISSILVTWSMDSGSDVVSYKVSSNSHSVTITPLKAGTAVLRATSGEFTSTLTITVEETEITSIDLWGSTQLTTSSSGNAYAYVYDQFGASLSNEKIIWSVDNPDLLTVSQTETKGGYGVTLTPKGVGTVNLTATSKSNPTVSSEQTIVIESPVATSLSLSGSSQLTTARTGSASAYVCDQFGYQISSILVTWSMDSGSDIVSYMVSSNTYSVTITPLKAGTAVLRATSGEFTNTLTITVEETVVTSMDMWGSSQFTTACTGYADAYVCDQFGYEISSIPVTWSLDSGSDVVSYTVRSDNAHYVDITPLKAGTAVLRATSGELTNTLTITVEETEITSVYLWGSTQLTTSSSGNAYAYVYDQFGSHLSNEKIIWSVDNPDLLTVSQTETKGGYGVTLTPKGVGTVTLTATSKSNPSISSEQTIVIESPVAISMDMWGSSQFTTARTGYADAYVCDQFGYQISSIPVTWSLDSGSDVVSYTVRSDNAHYVDITPLKAGTAVLRATSGEFTNTLTITVEETEITSVYLWGSTQLTTSSSGDAYAYVMDQFGASLSNEKIIWSVDNPDLLTVSQTETRSGYSVTLTPKGVGTVALTATSKSNPTISSEQTIVIESPVATSMSISGSTELTTARTGSAYAYVRDQFGYQISSIPVTWSLDSGSDIISYKVQSGNTHYVDITPLKAGSAILRATSGELTQSLTITVEETEITSIYLWGSTQLTTSCSGNAYAYVMDQFECDLSNEKIIWSVDKPELLTLSQTETKGGRWVTLTPKGVGTINLTATSKSNPSISSEQMIVIESPVATSLFLSGSTELTTLRTGNAYAYVRDQFGYEISSTPVTWSLDSGSDVLSYTVRSDTKSVTLTPLKAGVAVLHATSGEFTKNMTITVEETEITSLYLDSSTQLTTSSSGNAYAYARDQFDASLSSEKIIWAVDKPDLLTLSKSETTSNRGITLTPKGVGTVNITATSKSNPSISAEKTIVIESPVATSIYVDIPDGISLNNTGYAYAYVRDQFNNQISDIPLLWEPVNGDETIANSLYLYDQYHHSATLIPLKEGTATLNVSSTTSSGIISETKTIKIEKERIMGIDLYGSSQIQMDDTGYAYAYVYDQFSSTLPDRNITWSIESGNEYISIQTVADEPSRLIISALNPGTAVLKASYGDISETMTVVVTEAAVSQTYSALPSNSGSSDQVNIYGSARILNTGTWYVSAALYNSKTGELSTDETTWSIVSGADNLTIAADPEKQSRAIMTPKKTGTAVIRAVINGISAEQTIEIFESTSEPYLEISRISKISSMGSGQAWAYVSADINNEYITGSISMSNAVVNWSVLEGSDVLSLVPATTLYSNYVMITPKKAGTAVIKAEFAGMSTTDTIEICEADLSLVLSGYSVFYLTKSEAYQMHVVDQFGTIVSTPAASWDIIEGSEIFALTSSAAGNPVVFVPLREGRAVIEFSAADSPEQSQSFAFRVIDKQYPGEDPTPEEEEEEKIPAPTISPNGKTFDTSCTVTISSDYKDAKLYYTTADDVEESPSAQTIMSTFTEYSEELNITESTTIHAAVIYVNEDQEVIASKLSKAQFTKYVPDAEFGIATDDAVCGNISTAVTKAKAGDIIAVTFTADPDYKLSTWTVTGDISGNTQENKNSVSSFVMWSEPVTITAEFRENEKPKADSIVISRLPDTLYTYEDTHDTGTLTATVYDQFGTKFADSVTWSSDSPAIEINATSGAYTAKSPGSANITARSVSDSSVKETVVLVAYYPPSPQITNEIHGGELGETEFGVLDDDLITVSTTNTKYLSWDWDDGSTTLMATYGVSPTTVGHTFIQYGDRYIDVTPSNKYRAGDTKTFHVKVIHAVPANLVITDGPKSVTQGETHTYTAYATNANYYEWKLNDTVVSGETQSTASITFPDSGVATVSVKAFNADGISGEAVTKTVNVAAAGGVLGDFGTLTTTPETPVVNELASFSIPAVENAVKYTWKFSTAAYETTAPAIQHTLAAETDVSITVTAYNSVGDSTKHTYILPKVGVKPTVTITASPESLEVYQTTVCTASCSAQDVVYTWYLDDVKISGASSAEYQKKWTYDDVGTHTISVAVSNDYGSSSASAVITVTPKSGEAPEINGIHGQVIVKKDSSQKYFINVKSKDPCSVTWYLNDVVIGTESSSKNGNGKQFDIEHVFTETGSYKLEAEVTADNGVTSPQTVSKTLEIEVVTEDDFSGAKKDDTSKGKPQKSVNPQMVNNNSEENALSLVDGIALDHDDLNKDGEPVHINVSKLSDDDLREFTNDMGKTEDVKLALDINPEGLKNEKDLTRNAVLTFKLSKEGIGDDPKKVSFFRYDTGSAEQGWMILTFAEDPYEDESGKFWVYSVLTNGFSQIAGIYTGTELSVGTPDSPTPVPTYSSSSSHQSGATYILPEGDVVPTATPTVASTQAPATPTVIATAKPTTQPTQSSPAPLAGLIVGLGAAALVLARMRR